MTTQPRSDSIRNVNPGQVAPALPLLTTKLSRGKGVQMGVFLYLVHIYCVPPSSRHELVARVQRLLSLICYFLFLGGTKIFKEQSRPLNEAPIFTGSCIIKK